MRSSLRSLAATCALSLVLAAPVAAQDGPGAEPPPDAPPVDAPASDPDAPAGGEDRPREGWEAAREQLDVERPEELARIQDELSRIRRERQRLLGQREDPNADPKKDLLGPGDLERITSGSQSPVLSPRDEVLGLTLQQAVSEALTNNPDYLVQLLAARAAAEGVDQQVAAFDPTLGFTGSFGKSRPPFFSTNAFSGFAPGLSVAYGDALSTETTLSQRLRLGTTLSLTWTDGRRRTENQFSLNPSYAPTLKLDISQPLLRGFGWDVNTAPIRIAENDSLTSDAQLADTYLQAVVAIEEAYWGLVRAEEELRFQERSLSSAIKFLDDQRKREEHGAGTRLEVTIAKAGVAERREAVIVAENNLEAARDQMIRLTQPSSDSSKWDRYVVPVDLPRIVAEPALDAGAAIQGAIKRRPDYWRAQLAVESARESVTVAENGVLPALDVFSSWSQEGLADGHREAWSKLGSGRFYTWQVGIRFNLPLVLRSERAQLRAARLRLEQAEASVRALEASIVLDVRTAIRNIRTARARIEATRASRILAQERLEATRVQVETGTAVPRDVLDDLADLAAAESAEIQAYINYRLSISRFRAATGDLLEEWLEQLDPRVRRALDRLPYR